MQNVFRLILKNSIEIGLSTITLDGCGSYRYNLTYQSVSILLLNLKYMSTKDKILDIAESLFAQFGYSAVSMSSIAKEVKTTKAALYYHFTSKIDLLTEIIEGASISYKKGLQTILDENSESFEAQLRASIIFCLKFSSKQSNLIIFLQKIYIQNKQASLIIDKTKKEIIKIWEKMITNVIRLHTNDEHFDVRLTTLLVLSMVHSFMDKGIMDSKEKIKYDYEVIADRIMSFITPVEQKSI